MLQLPLSPIRQATPLGLGSCLPARGCIQRETLCLPEAVFKEKFGIWDPMPELNITSPYPHSRLRRPVAKFIVPLTGG